MLETMVLSQSWQMSRIWRIYLCIKKYGKRLKKINKTIVLGKIFDILQFCLGVPSTQAESTVDSLFRELDFCWGSLFCKTCKVSDTNASSNYQKPWKHLFVLCHKVQCTSVHRVTALSGIGVHLPQKRGLGKCLKANTVCHRQADRQALLIQPTD